MFCKDYDNFSSGVAMLVEAGLGRDEIAKRLGLTTWAVRSIVSLLRDEGRLPPSKHAPKPVKDEAAEIEWLSLAVPRSNAATTIRNSRPIVPKVKPSGQPFQMEAMRGPDPHRAVRLQQTAKALKGKV